MTLKTVIKLAEPKTFSASLLPVLMASVYAYMAFDTFSWVKLLCLSIGMLLVQAATNMINDYFDYKRQTDLIGKADEKALASGEVSLKQLKQLIMGFIALALCIGFYYAFTMSLWILVVIALSMSVSFLYSGGKYPLCHGPFGELAAGLTMGFGIIPTVIFIQSEVFNLSTVATAIPTVLFIAALLLANNLSDHQEDAQAGRRTSVVLMGTTKATWLWLGLMLGMYVVTAILSFSGLYDYLVLLAVVIALPTKGLYLFKITEKKRANKGLLMGTTSKIGLFYHVALILGFLAVKFSLTSYL